MLNTEAILSIFKDWSSVLVIVLVYTIFVFIIAIIRALIQLRKGTDEAKKKFKEIFWNYLIEIINPLNWI